MPQQRITQIAREHSGDYIGIYPSGHLLLKSDAKILFDYDGGIISGKDIFFPEDTNFGGNVYLDKISSDWQKGISIGDPKNFFDYLSQGRFSTYSENLYGTVIAQDSDYMFLGLLDSGENEKISVIGFGDDYGNDKLEFIFFDYGSSLVKTIMTISTGGILINQDSSQSSAPVTNDKLNASGAYILDRAVLDSDISSNGLIVRTANGSYTSRSISVDNSLSISYADGVSSNPYITISSPYKALINNSVQITGNQSIAGIKSFSDKIQVSGEVVLRSNLNTNSKYKGAFFGDQLSNSPGHFDSLFHDNLFGVTFSWDTDYMFIGLNNSGVDKKRATIGFGDNYGTDSLDFVFFDYNTSMLRSLFSITTGGIFAGGGDEIVSKYYIDSLFEQSIHNSDFSSNGIMVRTSAGNYASRAISPSNGISITNGDGVSSNPTISIDSTSYNKINTAILDSDISSNGLMTRTSDGVYASRSITAGNGLSVDYGNGVSSNPYIYIDSYNHGLIHSSVQITGNQTINGIKNFSLSPIIPIGDSSGEAINYNQFVESGNYIYSLIDNMSSTGISRIMTDLSILSGNLSNTGEHLLSELNNLSGDFLLTGSNFDSRINNIVDNAIFNSDFSSSGLMAKVGNDEYANRELIAGIGIIISNGNGISSNPTISIDNYSHDLIINSIQITGDQTINGVKTFASSPIIPNGDSTYEAINFGQLVETGNFLKNSLIETGEYLYNILDSSIFDIYNGSGIEIGDAGSVYFKNDSGYFTPIDISSITGDVFISDGHNPRWAKLENEINVLGVKINNTLVLTEQQPALQFYYSDLDQYNYVGTQQKDINSELKNAINLIRVQLTNLAIEVRNIRHGLTNDHHLFAPLSGPLLYSGEALTISGETITISF
jgi:hypothetical protein